MEATKEKICDPTPGSSISTAGVWGQVSSPLESIEEGELYPAIPGMGPIRIGRTDSSDT